MEINNTETLMNHNRGMSKQLTKAYKFNITYLKK